MSDRGSPASPPSKLYPSFCHLRGHHCSSTVHQNSGFLHTPGCHDLWRRRKKVLFIILFLYFVIIETIDNGWKTFRGVEHVRCQSDKNDLDLGINRNDVNICMPCQHMVYTLQICNWWVYIDLVFLCVFFVITLL